MSDKKEKQKEKLQQDIKNYQRYIELLSELRNPEYKCPLCQGNKFKCDRCIAGIRVLCASSEDENKFDELESLRKKLGKQYLCKHCDGEGSFRFMDKNKDYYYEDCHYCNGNQILSPEEKQ